MKAQELKDFIFGRHIEYHWVISEEDVILFIDYHWLETWSELLGHGIFDDEGLEVIMKDGYLCFYMKDILERYDIELTDIFKEGKDWE